VESKETEKKMNNFSLLKKLIFTGSFNVELLDKTGAMNLPFTRFKTGRT
jgi:hypothetical protein